MKFNDFLNLFQERAKNPIWKCFVSTYLLYHWQGIVKVFKADHPKAVEILKTDFLTGWWLLIFLVVSIAFVLGNPWLIVFLNKIQKKVNALLKDIELENRQKDLEYRIEELKNIHTEDVEKIKKNHSDMIETLTKSSTLISNEIEEKKKEVDRLNEEIADRDRKSKRDVDAFVDLKMHVDSVEDDLADEKAITENLRQINQRHLDALGSISENIGQSKISLLLTLQQLPKMTHGPYSDIKEVINSIFENLDQNINSSLTKALIEKKDS